MYIIMFSVWVCAWLHDKFLSEVEAMQFNLHSSNKKQFSPVIIMIHHVITDPLKYYTYWHTDPRPVVM